MKLKKAKTKEDREADQKLLQVAVAIWKKTVSAAKRKAWEAICLTIAQDLNTARGRRTIQKIYNKGVRVTRKKHNNPGMKANELNDGFVKRSSTSNIPVESLRHLENQKTEMEKMSIVLPFN